MTEVPPQAPEGGWTRRLLGRFHVTGSFWYRFHHWGICILPRWAVGPIILLFTTFFFIALRRIRRAIARNLEVVLGPCGWWERQQRIYRTMWNLAWCLSERYERLSGKRQPTVTLTGEEIWSRKVQGSEGFVVVTAHIGNWETAMLNPGAGRERSIHVIREVEVDPRAQEFLKGLVQRQAGDRVHMHFAHADNARLAGELLVALRGGEIVAAQGDRPRSGGRTSTVSFFGRKLDLPIGPAVLARAAGVEMVPIFCFRRGRLETEIVIRPPIRVETTTDRRADVRRAVEKVVAETEWAIRQHPFQWFCFRDLWGEPPRRRDADRSGGWSSAARARSSVWLLASGLTLGGWACSALREPVAPMRAVEYPAVEAGPEESLIVLLPGRSSRPEAFQSHGLLDVVRRARPDARVLAVDAHLGYYRSHTIRERFRVDVLEPAAARHEEVWLVGTSLGGLGALSMAAFFPGEIDGVVLLAPYLGSGQLIREIESAGGPARWRPAREGGDVFETIWDRTRQHSVGGGPKIYLGFGSSDRLARGCRLLSELLPGDQAVELKGGHRWSVWRALLDELIARGALGAPASQRLDAPESTGEPLRG